MADRRRKDSPLFILIGPDARLRIPVALPLGLTERRRRVEQLDRVVKLSLRSNESLPEVLHDGMIGFDVVDRVRVVRAVAWRLHPDEIEPLVIARPVTVHRAVNQNRRQPFAMRLDDVLDKVLFLDVGKAFVVDDDVEAV